MDASLSFSHTSALTYNIVSVEGEITINSLLLATAELNRLANNTIVKDLVIDLSKVTHIDSSGIRLLINLNKKVQANSRQFYMMKPSKPVVKIFEDTNLTTMFTYIESSEILDKQAVLNEYKNYLPYTTKENGHLRLNCSCPVCGSKKVIGYLIDQDSLAWRWVNDNPFPSVLDKQTNAKCDYYSLMPIICEDCYMSSIKISNFNVLKENTIVFKSTLHDESKRLLTKSIKRRKKIMEQYTGTGSDTYMHPRDKAIISKTYELAEFCARTVSVLKADASAFDVGYLNYLAIRYSNNEDKTRYINNCRTWFTQAMQSVPKITTIEFVISYFVLLLCDLNLNKQKEAAQIFSEYTKMIKELPSTVSSEGISSPHFWYNQAEVIWRCEIEDKSNAIRF